MISIKILSWNVLKEILKEIEDLYFCTYFETCYCIEILIKIILLLLVFPKLVS